MATNFGDGHPIDSDCLESFLYLFQLERLDNRFNLFHFDSLSSLGFEIVAFFAVHAYIETGLFFLAIEPDAQDSVADLQRDQ